MKRIILEQVSERGCSKTSFLYFDICKGNHILLYTLSFPFIFWYIVLQSGSFRIQI